MEHLLKPQIVALLSKLHGNLTLPWKSILVLFVCGSARVWCCWLGGKDTAMIKASTKAKVVIGIINTLFSMSLSNEVLLFFLKWLIYQKHTIHSSPSSCSLHRMDLKKYKTTTTNEPLICDLQASPALCTRPTKTKFPKSHQYKILNHCYRNWQKKHRSF